jgi:AcrR family transcriptional regulator
MPDGRQEHRPMAERREQLLDAAVEVMRDGGVQALTTRSVTTRAGLPHGAFHYCFASKDDLVQALLERELAGSLLEAWDAVSDLGDPEQGIEAALRSYVDHVRSDPAYQLGVEELTIHALRSPEGQVALQYHRRIVEDACALITRWSHRRRLSWTVPIETLAELLIASASGVGRTWLITRDDAAAEATVRAQARAFRTLAVPDA